MKKILLMPLFILLLTGCITKENKSQACLEESLKLDLFIKDEKYWGNKTKINEIFTLKDKCIYEIEEREYSDKHKGVFTMATFHIYDFSKRKKIISYNVGQCFEKEDDLECLKNKENDSDKYFELRLKIEKESL